MKAEQTSRQRPRTVLVALGLAIAMALVFVLDTVTDYAVAAALFYTTVILVATRNFSVRTVVALACLCAALTVLSFALTHSGFYEVGLVNTGFSIVAIGVTTYLALRLVTAEAAAGEARERLMRMARITTMGELSASIAHEVNQPLAAMVASAGAGKRWLAQEPPNVEKAVGAFDRIVSDASRAGEVIARIRRMTKGEVAPSEPFDFNAAVSEAVRFVQTEAERREVQLNLELADDLPDVLADKVKIEQVALNLLLNAIEATALVEAPARTVTIRSVREGAHEIMFSVSDTGPGFKPGEANALFDAFWTTKPDGMGLGLAISKSIIEANGGRIWASNRHPGAVFSFTLPLAARPHHLEPTEDGR